jgi:beta-lactamase superfamily II metal-dependent hydrolase
LKIRRRSGTSEPSEFPEKIDSDILKVAHHGSRTSSREEFLEAVSPEIAVVQVGRKNRYGHPTQEVLDRLATVGAQIFRNDLDGDIRVESDGSRFWVVK